MSETPQHPQGQDQPAQQPGMPYPQYGQYAPPQQQPVYVTQPTKTNGFSIAALVLGIVWIYWIGSILALVFGYIAKSQIDNSGGTQSGRGMAIAGIVLGWVGIGVLLLLIVVGVGVGIGGA